MLQISTEEAHSSQIHFTIALTYVLELVGVSSREFSTHMPSLNRTESNEWYCSLSSVKVGGHTTSRVVGYHKLAHFDRLRKLRYKLNAADVRLYRS